MNSIVDSFQPKLKSFLFWTSVIDSTVSSRYNELRGTEFFFRYNEILKIRIKTNLKTLYNSNTNM